MDASWSKYMESIWCQTQVYLSEGRTIVYMYGTNKVEGCLVSTIEVPSYIDWCPTNISKDVLRLDTYVHVCVVFGGNPIYLAQVRVVFCTRWIPKWSTHDKSPTSLDCRPLFNLCRFKSCFRPGKTTWYCGVLHRGGCMCIFIWHAWV